MHQIITISSFVFFTALVAFVTWLMTRKEDVKSKEGYFLAGRSLTYPFIAGSLLLTNLSTEQMVGLNGSAFKEGLCVMAWEVVAVIALVAMAMFFLPRFLKAALQLFRNICISGLTGQPQSSPISYSLSHTW